jgi:hypothetical protein
MRRALPLVLLLLTACQARPSAEQAAAIASYNEEMFEQAASGKLRWAEYARRTNTRFQEVLAGDQNLSGADIQAALEYRVYLASEVDAGRSTPEYSDNEWRRFLAQGRPRQSGELETGSIPANRTQVPTDGADPD